MQIELKEIIDKIRKILSRKLGRYNKKLPYIIIVVIASILVLGCTKLFTELTENIGTKVFGNLDDTITLYIISFRNPALTTYFKFVTNVGSRNGYIIILIFCALIFYLIFKNWKYVVELTIVLLLASVSNIILKQIINRARPSIEHLVNVKSLSYPSGHAMTAMAFYGFLIYLVYKFKMNSYLKLAVITCFIILILSIGISRIYLGVHFPSDIVGGFIAGFIWVMFCVLILNVILLFREDPNT